ncbi:MAG: hypothetical protein ACO3D0_12400 [Ilumatobacteraceae bacterium]
MARGRTAVRERWAAVGDRLEALGLKLDMHYQQESTRPDGGPVDDGLARAGAAIGDAFDALGEAVADSAVRSDVREAGRLLVEAVNSTLDEVGATIRRRSREP